MNDTTFQGDGKITFVPVVVNTKLTKPSNADRIRTMTNEELAELMEDKGDCPPIECPHDSEGAKVTRLDCKACWLDWLKQEASE